ncbi:hypothetical protein [Shewanella sp. FJAT-52076]|uniref:hypothetical protein n=1 Tax=Shewanella sp. FJAT-52076 TaxID=2864202 RepID=UPI001C657C1A|nr:hypothetical protein [Shewanella sp. FJAT-52076]QYJ75592.1 hypothetical protein K0H79_00855 [Shewanella sp. FJAT-52076]
MKTLITTISALAIGLIVGATLFSRDSTSQPPIPELSQSAHAITAAAVAFDHSAPTTDTPALDSTMQTSPRSEAALNQSVEAAVEQQNQPEASSQPQTLSMGLREQICEIQASEDYCELSSATDFEALLLNKNDTVNVGVVSVLLDANNFEVFSEWLSYANRTEQASQFEEALNSNLTEMAEILPELDVDKPVCSDSICTLTVRYPSEAGWDKAKDLLFRDAGLKNIFVSATVDGQRRYIAFKSSKGIIVNSNQTSSSGR